MSKFNKCKDCQSTQPESGWVTSACSLCNDCASTRAARAKAANDAAYKARQAALAELKKQTGTDGMRVRPNRYIDPIGGI